jgi:histidine ammonia-lyase
MAPALVVLTGEDLTITDVVRVARDRVAVTLAAAAADRISAAWEVVASSSADDSLVYGLSTGVGALKRMPVTAEEASAFNRHLLRNHLVGQGPPAGQDVVRAALLRLANSFAKGTSCVRLATAQRYIDALNDGARPAVRSLGSVGVSDLAPMADLAVAVVGDHPLMAGEALALINNNSFSGGHAALAVADASRLLDTFDVAAALSLEGFAANLSILHPEVAASRRHPGTVSTVARLRGLLDGSALWATEAARNLQDPLTFRCVPQTHGAARDALAHVAQTVTTELNAAQTNPHVVTGEQRIVSTGNFDSVALSAATDYLRIAFAPVLTSAQERAVKLLQPPLSGLPYGLAAESGLAEGGLSEFGISIQAVAAEARLLAQPVSSEVVSTSQAEGIEDRMTLAPLSARRLADLVGLAEIVAAIELVIAAQAVELRQGGPLGAGTAAACALVRQAVAFQRRGAGVPDIAPVLGLVRAGTIAALPTPRRCG